MTDRKLIEFAARAFADHFFPEDFSNDTYEETKRWILNNYTPWLELSEEIKTEIMKIIDGRSD